MRETHGYIIERTNADGSRSFYADGWGIWPQWTARYNANVYGAKRAAIATARKVGGDAVRPQHDPFGTARAVWVR